MVVKNILNVYKFKITGTVPESFKYSENEIITFPMKT
jgi:hypothetical protein